MRLKYVLLFTLLTVCTIVLSEDVTQPEVRQSLIKTLFNFESFKQSLKKSYKGVEDLVRKKLYLGNVFRVFVSVFKFKHDTDSGYFLAINHMSDWTPEEVDSMYMAPEKLEDQLDSLASDYYLDSTELDPNKILVPAADLEDIDSGLEELSKIPDFDKIAKELLSVNKHQRSKRNPNIKRDLKLQDVMRRPEVVPETSSKISAIESNNPNYTPAEFYSFGSEIQAKPLNEQAIGFIMNLPGADFVSNVVSSVSSTTYDLIASMDPEEEEIGEDIVYADHRRSECLFQVRDQKKCGCCYIFASTALYEWLFCMQTGKLIALSEQYILDCGNKGGLDGCGGGQNFLVSRFAAKYGWELRDKYPYRMFNREEPLACPFDEEKSMGYLRIAGTKLKNIEYNRSLLELWLAQAPILMGLRVSPDFMQYGGGVHLPKNCNGRGHSMLIIGHGRENGREYWLIRNSHSADWGELGYYKLDKRVRDECLYVRSFYAPQAGGNFALKRNDERKGNFVAEDEEDEMKMFSEAAKFQKESI